MVKTNPVANLMSQSLKRHWSALNETLEECTHLSEVVVLSRSTRHGLVINDDTILLGIVLELVGKGGIAKQPRSQLKAREGVSRRMTCAR